MSNEIHLREPVYYGDRTRMAVGIAHFRVTKDGKPKKGNIKIWIDMKVTDKNTGLPTLAYPYPFSIPCAKVITYPTQILNDYHRTMLHIIPLEHLKIVKTRRKRTVTQDEFKQIIQGAYEIR